MCFRSFLEINPKKQIFLLSDKIELKILTESISRWSSLTRILTNRSVPSIRVYSIVSPGHFDLDNKFFQFSNIQNITEYLKVKLPFLFGFLKFVSHFMSYSYTWRLQNDGTLFITQTLQSGTFHFNQWDICFKTRVKAEVEGHSIHPSLKHLP